MRVGSSLILPEVDAWAQVPGCPSPLNSHEGEDRVFYSKSGGGAGWRGSGDTMDNARVETEGPGPLEQCFEGEGGKGGLRPLAQHWEMAGGTQLAEVVRGLLFADSAEKGKGWAPGTPFQQHSPSLPQPIPAPLNH